MIKKGRMHTEIISSLHKRFGKQPYWRLMLRDIESSTQRSHTITPLADTALHPPATLRHIHYNVRSFITACQEAVALREHFLRVSVTSPEGKRFSALFKDLDISSFLDDVQWFREELLKHAMPEKIVQDASWVWDEQFHQYTLLIGAELLWLLSISRCIGLIPLQLLLSLKDSKIKVIGASVAAMTMDLLVSLGAENIACVDPGRIDPSNSPRLPQGGYALWGDPKSSAVLQTLQRRNPYGKYECKAARIITSEHQHQRKSDVRLRKSDVFLPTFLQGGDVIIEVVDDIALKRSIHEQVTRLFPKTPLIFIADLGNRPIVKIVRQPLVSEKLSAVQATYAMVEDYLPAEHALQFVSACVGLLPFWAQTPIASRSSAALAVSALLQALGHSHDLPGLYVTTSSLAPKRIVEERDRIFQICRTYLELP